MLADLPYTLLTIFGIGLVIFVHELGHYWAARAVGIRVDAFSIGFGPRLVGWKRGTCDWKICLIPLGGYVKMAGEDPTRPTTGRNDEFGSKTVGQRVLVISAGVIMNVIFALVTIPILFAIGVPFPKPEIGLVAQGSPAAEAGLRIGDRILEVDGRRVLGFSDVAQDVAVGGATVTLKLLRDGVEREVQVQPRDFGSGVPSIGIGGLQPEILPLSEELFSATEFEVPEAPQIRDLLKSAGVRVGDRIAAIDGVPIEDYALLYAERLLNDARPFTATFERSDGTRIDAVIPGELRPAHNPTSTKILGTTAGQQVGVPRAASSPLPDGLQAGDELLTLNGQPIEFEEDLDLLLGGGRPLMLKRDEERFEPSRIELGIRRGAAPQTLSFELPTALQRRAFRDAVPLAVSKELRVFPATGALAAAGAKTGEVIVRADGEIETLEGIRALIKDQDGQPVTVRLRGADGSVRELKVAPDHTREHSGHRGLFALFELRPRTVTVQTGFVDSLHMGVLLTQRFGERVINTLRSILTGQVASRQLGGIITIFIGSKQHSQFSILQGFLFLTMISINLAILNILPIPVLDGGWLMFLLIEKIQGKPVGQKTMAVCQYIGLALILALMVYVTRNDVLRLLGWM